MAEAQRDTVHGRGATFDAETIVAAYPGPACLVGQHQRVIHANDYWHGLDDSSSGPVPLPLIGSVRAVQRTGRPQRVLATFADQGGHSWLRSMDATLLPCTDDGEQAVLIMATDSNPDADLCQALAESRNLHRDLALCSTDLVFETDTTGRFTYVGINGFLGHTDHELLGTRVRNLVTEESQPAIDRLLGAREVAIDVEVHFVSRRGDERIHMMSCMPAKDTNGEWTGMRGVGRDVTEIRIREQEIAQVRHAQRLVDEVLHAMRSEIDPVRMLHAGTAAAIDAMELAASCVISLDADGGRRMESSAQSRSNGAGTEDCPIDESMLESIGTTVRRGSPFEAQMGGSSVIAIPATRDGRSIGAVVLVRDWSGADADGADAWSDEDRQIARALAGQCALALAQKVMIAELQRGESE